MQANFVKHSPAPGTYELHAPSNWKVQASAGEAGISNETDSIAVNVSVFVAETKEANLDAGHHLDRYLSSVDAIDAHRESVSKLRAKASYQDQSGRLWKVAFASRGNRLLLATLNTDADVPNQLRALGHLVFESIKLCSPGDPA